MSWARAEFLDAANNHREPSLVRLPDVRRQILAELGKDVGGEVLTYNGILPELIDAFVGVSGDPDTTLAEWFKKGAPFGIEVGIDPNSVFPAARDTREYDYSGVPVHHAEPDGWGNYRSAEEDMPTVDKLLQDMLDKGWAVQFGTLQDVMVYLQTDQGIPLKLINKVGLITKVRDDGTLKHRLVWDLRRSGVNAAAHQSQRVVLPKINDILEEFPCSRKTTLI
eukprot:511419-Amphidinium_carterae.1